MAKTYLNKAMACLILAAAALAGANASAQTISLTTDASFGGPDAVDGGIAYDPTTGYYYYRPGYDTAASGATPTVIVYDSKAAFLSNQPSGTITLDGSQAGTYFAVDNGILYSRIDATSNVVGEWNLATKTELGTVTLNNMLTTDATGSTEDTFTLAQNTGLNFLQDSTGLYALGVSADGQDWVLDKVDLSLNAPQNILQSYTITDPDDSMDPLSISFAFMAGGELFLGDPNNSDTITYVFNLATRQLSQEGDINISLDGPPSFGTVENALYVSQSDSLYLLGSGLNSATLYGADRVSPSLGIPEPSTWALLVTGLAACLGGSFLRRKGAVRAGK